MFGAFGTTFGAFGTALGAFGRFPELLERLTEFSNQISELFVAFLQQAPAEPGAHGGRERAHRTGRRARAQGQRQAGGEAARRHGSGAAQDRKGGSAEEARGRGVRGVEEGVSCEAREQGVGRGGAPSSLFSNFLLLFHWMEQTHNVALVRLLARIFVAVADV